MQNPHIFTPQNSPEKQNSLTLLIRMLVRDTAR
jgi:hypothetical protein